MSLKIHQNTLAIIPARYSSTRFPGKPLAEIDGKTMIQHVWENAVKTKGIDEVIVATDDNRIFSTVSEFGGKVVLTDPNHETGTDRIVEALSGRSCDWVINIQGDEPLMSSSDLERLIKKAQNSKGTNVATLVQKIFDEVQLNDPNIVKVTLNKKNHALYFSRSLIPFHGYSENKEIKSWRHLGVYIFKRDFLINFYNWPQTELEKTEKLEQLRILENGENLLCVEAEKECVSVDVPMDIELVEKILKKHGIKDRTITLEIYGNMVDLIKGYELLLDNT